MSAILRALRRTASRLTFRRKKKRRKGKSETYEDLEETKQLTSLDVPDGKAKKSDDVTESVAVEVHSSAENKTQEAEEDMETVNGNGSVKGPENGEVSSDSTSDAETGKGGKWKFRDKVKRKLLKREISESEPDECVDTMKFPSVHKFAALKKKLKNAHKDWVQSFLDNGGLDVLLDCVDDVGTKRVNLLSDALLLLECVSCIKRLVNNQSGVAYLVQHGSYTKKLVKGLYSS